MSEGTAKTVILLLELTHPDGSVGRYSKHDLELEGTGFFSGRILQCSQLRREAPVNLAGFIRSTVTLELADTDRHFSELEASGWLNRTATLKMAILPSPGQQLSSRTFTDIGERILVEGEPLFLTPPHDTPTPVAAFKTLFTGAVADYQFGEGSFAVTIKSLDHRWMEREYQTRVTLMDFPNAPASSLGALLPIVYGVLEGGV